MIFITFFFFFCNIRQNSTNLGSIIIIGDFMNLFDIVLLDMILILFPFFFYIIYLVTNKNLNQKTKELMFIFSIITSFFLFVKFQYNSYYLINFLILSSVILITYLKKHCIIANLLLFILYNSIDINIIMFIPCILLIFLYLLKELKNLSDFLFIDIYIVLEFVCLLIVDGFNLYNLFIFILVYLIINIIYYLLISSERIVKYHMDYKELQEEKKIRLSLFKITHEIKNPIAVCKGYLDMLDVNNDIQVKKYIPIVKSEIERLLSLLEDFLLVNKNNVDLDIMDINLLIEDVIDKLKPMLDEKNITLSSDLIDDEVYINGDYKRLSQVFINLVKNSIEAIPSDRNGIISIKNKICNNNLNIVIEDNGLGISNKILKHIKEPFFTTKVKGTGLGVSLSNEIISAHNGTLQFFSKEGEKTKTVIKLPLYNEA